MDGRKGALRHSLQWRLSLWLGVTILAVAAVAGTASFVLAFDDAIELQDGQLRQMAALLQGRHLTLAPSLPSQGPFAVDRDAQVVIRLLPGAPAVTRDAESPLADLSPDLPDGLHTLNSSGDSWRVLVTTLEPGTRAAVAQRIEARNEIAQDSARRTLTPLLMLVPVILALIVLLTRRMFRPLQRIATELDRRSELDLRPLPKQALPLEVQPFVTAINRLFVRVAQSVANQRRFVADAAHELRSPLTAMSLQAEHLAEAEMSGPARERLTVLRQGISRGGSLLEQLLTLARMQASNESPNTPISVLATYRRVLEELMPLADAKNIDITAEGTQDAMVWVCELDLFTLVRNLVDNAIRYTPRGGRVYLSVNAERSRTMLRIRDTGPGIPLDQRVRVFDRFYRLLGSEQVGSGLGLSIVQAIATRIGAEVHLAFSDEAKQTGLTVEVLIPATHPLL